ncbi:MAG: sigma 54-interacting transcriptional regulator [Deltaproteobacteria bacterium]|nr:sigma 54-interacting transcriptional regulator [Deltaproteobacteria bacterium]
MAQTKPAQSIDAIIGTARSMEALRAQILRLAAFDAPGSAHVPTVLLQGETGTGKGLVARVIHESGPRAAAPFIDVNCGAIPEAMLEAELFGYEAGAFTDARRAKPGLFESASGGVLFLDEIDSLSLPVQSKVLKAIEEKRVRRLGAVVTRDVDVKLIAATQRDLAPLIANGGFRADLYHRLAVLVVTIPPLRARENDAVQLAEHFLQWYGAAHGLPPKQLTAGGREWLARQSWPGNVRELGHLVERITLLSPDDAVTPETLAALSTTALLPGPIMAASPAATAPATATSDVPSDEASRIVAALRRAGGNVVRAARALGIGRNALRYRMRRLGIDRLADADELPAAPATAAARMSTAPAPATIHLPTWEQKPVAVLTIALAFHDGDGGAGVEPWTEALRWDRALTERVEGFGGVFVHRSPSRLTAVFGIPRALEQAPQRAVQAALAIQRAVAQASPRQPDVRAAIHLGDVRIDSAATDPTAQLFPIGDALALPERLLGHAGAGEVIISPTAARRVDRSFELHVRPLQLGPAVADYLTAYTVGRQHPHAADGGLLVETATNQFVGRARELGLLRDAFARAAEGHGQVAFVVGDAGMGKSRLLAELRRCLADVPHRWVEGHCASYGTETPFLPIIDALRRGAGIDDEDDDASSNAKIGAQVERLGVDLAWTLPFVRQLLSPDTSDDAVRKLDSASRRSELFRALHALTVRAAELVPVVMVIEDLHWIDRASEEYLAFVGDVVPTTRMLLVLSHRTGYRHPFPDRSYHVRVALPPLSGADMTAMTGVLLGTTEIPETLRGLIARKAEGNPFFVEELTRSLLEDGTLRREQDRVVLADDLRDVAVPDTIQDVLIARIDRLAEESRRAIQIASVIGREFALRLLARITDAGEQIRTQVDELRGLELIYEKALHPELAYMFKHALTHDVAYESVLVDRRTALHRTIGRTIEELYADRLAEHYETLAHHFSRGEDWKRALLYHERSAEKAAVNHANRAVVEHCRAALAIADRLGAQASDEVRRRVNERLGRACFYLSEFAASALAYEEAAAHSADAETRTFHLAAAGFSHCWGHRYESSRRCIDATLTEARHHRVPAGEAMGLVIDGFYAAVHDSDPGAFEEHLMAALSICARHPHPLVEAFARSQLVLTAEWSGDYGRARDTAERAIALGRQHQLPEVIIFSTWFLGKALCCTGNFGGAISVLEEAYQLCDRIGDRAFKSRLLNTLGWCFAEVGSSERARAYNQRAALLAREIGDPEITSNADINLAANHLALGDLDAALRCLEPIEAMLAVPGDPWMRWRYGLHVQHLRGQIELQQGSPERALRCAQEQLNGAHRHRAAKVEARALLLRGSALLALDEYAEADVALQAGLGTATQIGYQRGIWQAHALLAEQAQRMGNSAAAAAHAAKARAAVQAAAGSLADNELRRCLEASVPLP